jgi:hypothetical protein
MSRILGSTILAIGIVCAPVILASTPGSTGAQSQPRVIKGDRIGAKPTACSQARWRGDETQCLRSTFAPTNGPGSTRLAALDLTHN